MKIKTLDDFMTKFNFSPLRLARRIGGVTRQSVMLWRTGVNKPRAKNLEKLQKIIDEYLPELKAKDLFEASEKEK